MFWLDWNNQWFVLDLILHNVAARYRSLALRLHVLFYLLFVHYGKGILDLGFGYQIIVSQDQFMR